jgi:hypothetical protein
VTRQTIREVLDVAPLDVVALLLQHQDADGINDHAVAILDRIGAAADFPPSGW